MNFQYLDAALRSNLEKAKNAYEAAFVRQEKVKDAFSVVIIGQQNNGKSTLCNALFRDWENRKFPVADRRLTSSTQEEQDEASGILYVDTPGFSSATATDDETAQTEWIRANLLIFVHSIRTGELDADEVRILQKLKSVVPDVERRLFVACSKAGGEKSEDLRLKLDLIRAQIRDHVGLDVTMEAIDSIFYQKGMEKGNEQLVASTNFPKILAWIAAGRHMPSSLEAFVQQAGKEYNRLLVQARENLEVGMSGFSSRRETYKNALSARWANQKPSVRGAWDRCAQYV